MKPRVFAIHYVLTGIDGSVLDSSDENQPLPFLEGAGQIIPALEKQILHLKEGDKATVQLKAEDAYGLPQEKMVMDVPVKELAHIQGLQIGSFLKLDLGEQTQMVRVTNMSPETVTLDGNHPLAGQDLKFEIEMIMVREATEEEMHHGHAHGIHGHSHH